MSSLLVWTFGSSVAAFFTFKLFNFDDCVVASLVFIVVVVAKIKYLVVVVVEAFDVTTEGWVINNAPENRVSSACGLLLVNLWFLNISLLRVVLVFCVAVEAIISCSENFGDAVVGDFNFLLVVVLSVVANFLICLVVRIDLGVVVEGVEVFNWGLTCVQGLKSNNKSLRMFTDISTDDLKTYPRGNSFPSPSSFAWGHSSPQLKGRLTSDSLPVIFSPVRNITTSKYHIISLVF